MLRRSLSHGLIACVFTLSSLTASSALADDDTGYRVKAIFISKIIGFITPISKEPKIEVCVLGDNPILDRAGSVQNISLVKESKLSNISSHCHALFIGAAESEEYKDVLAVLKGKPVLTFSDAPDFIERGGMVMFPQGRTIKPVINKAAIERAGLKADPLMLETKSVFEVIDD